MGVIPEPLQIYTKSLLYKNRGWPTLQSKTAPIWIPHKAVAKRGFVCKERITLMLKVEESISQAVSCSSVERQQQGDDTQGILQQAHKSNARKVIDWETYEALLRLADDGGPLVINLEDYEIMEK